MSHFRTATGCFSAGRPTSSTLVCAAFPQAPTWRFRHLTSTPKCSEYPDLRSKLGHYAAIDDSSASRLSCKLRALNGGPSDSKSTRTNSSTGGCPNHPTNVRLSELRPSLESIPPRHSYCGRNRTTSGDTDPTEQSGLAKSSLLGRPDYSEDSFQNTVDRPFGTGSACKLCTWATDCPIGQPANQKP